MAELRFYMGPMASGKSTLALQTAFNLNNSGVNTLLVVMNDRLGKGISSRIGLEAEALVIDEDTDLFEVIATSLASVIICDEAQFYTSHQVEQMVQSVDYLNVDVYAYGLLADFQSKLFPGSKRLLELSDRRFDLQVESRCWCGDRATQNARTINGWMTLEGDQVLVGDTSAITVDTINIGIVGGPPAADSEKIEYELLCRRHFMQRHTRKGKVDGPGRDQVQI